MSAAPAGTGTRPGDAAAAARAEALFGWYAREARDLPWRRTADPWAILVSEVMLQQTQVVRVAPRYEAFLRAWPTPAALAAAPTGALLRAWQGLGYPRRALRLREAARIVVRDGWPDDLRTLPGVGPYTAAAVGSFAFGRQEAAVDTNVARVCARWGAEPAAVLPQGRAATWNQAVMELGALVCRARSPRCDACPVASWCPSRGAVEPAARGTAPRPRFEETDRYARGRVLAAVLAGEPLPALDPDRLGRAADGLVADGLLARGTDGTVRAPA